MPAQTKFAGGDRSLPSDDSRSNELPALPLMLAIFDGRFSSPRVPRGPADACDLYIPSTPSLIPRSRVVSTYIREPHIPRVRGDCLRDVLRARGEAAPREEDAQL